VKTISIIGLGRVGGALAIALDRAGFGLDQLVYRKTPPRAELASLPGKLLSFAEIESINSDLVLIATEDQQLRLVAEGLSRLADLSKIVLHLSGSLSSEVLDSLRSRRVAVGSMHPLVSISDALLGADRFANAYFCVEGDPDAVSAAKFLVNSLKGNSFTIQSRFKPLYHSAAVMASGHITALFDAAVETLSKCELEPGTAKAILIPLVESTIANFRVQMPSGALTGPFVRGDIEAFLRHLDAFEGTVDENTRSVYLALAERSVRMAEMERSADTDFGMLAEAISMAKRKTEC
jgi:predicted short-subunit dehydrogenase-like oxidoreductase (DUF2520 family)